MSNLIRTALFLWVSVVFLTRCQQSSTSLDSQANGVQIAHLGQSGSKDLEQIRSAFSKANPGYDLDYYPLTRKLPAAEVPRAAFVQSGGGMATVGSGVSSKFSVGDVILLKKGESLRSDSLASFVVFTLPAKVPEDIPAFVRPDWDPRITDTPGGCATETNAYRRILLTWKDEVGPYRYHAINAHRVRIMDSFTHFHPVNGGFDEFYLVQMVQKEARIITSGQVERVINPSTVNYEQAQGILRTDKLHVGDLVYLPRGTIHRGLGGVLAQVITVPGFIPGSEIGVDHHLRTINERLGLTTEDLLPHNQEASLTAIIK